MSKKTTAQGVELISLALHCACTNLDEAGTRRHIRAALDAGATREDEDPAKLAEFYRTLPGVPGQKGARHRLIPPRMHPARAIWYAKRISGGKTKRQ